MLCLAATVSAQRYMAVTIDDLPVVSTNKTLAHRQKITNDLLKHVKNAKVPAIGFVNENKLYIGEKRDEPQIDLLRSWMNTGLELGNHTFWHKSLHAIELKTYQEEILQGEVITKELMKEKGKPFKYFRHPYLQTGLSLEIKKGLNEFLAKHNYTIAPVTIDNSDWAFARAYDNVFDKNDKVKMKSVGAAYILYMITKLDYWERQSIKLFGREPKQILLIHANYLNADYFDDLAKAIKGRGYKFITLDEALTDEVYKLPDTFTGRAGISWLHRWALAKGKENVLPDEPKVPDWVMKEAGLDPE